jgi:hypothetical protein
MNPRVSHAILMAAAVLVLVLLGARAADPVLYTAENISTAAHADPATVQKRSPGNAAALVPLMDDLLGQTGTLALTIKLKDYESAERDLARYSELSRQFDRLVVTLDVSGTDVGKFQQNNRQNQEALATLLNDTRRFEDLQSLEIEVRGDDEQHMAVVYEGEALRQKMREGFSAYAKRETATTRIAEHYEINATPYQESVEDFAEIADAADDWREEIGTGTKKSPLRIAVTPAEGRYGDTLLIAGTHASGRPGAPVEIYVDSRIAETVALDDGGSYRHPYRIGRVLAGPHLAYATAGPIYSEVAAFAILSGNTSITLALAEVNGTTVACTGNLTTDDGRPVTLAPVLLRVDGDTLVAAETDKNGTYEKEIVLPAGEHTLRAEFHGAGYPLNASESPAGTIIVRGEGLSPLPFAAALAALFGTGWYLRRRRYRQEESPVVEAPEEAAEEAAVPPPQVEIAGLPPREAATVLFCTLRARLGIAETKTPRDCARIAPGHAGFFERYELIRYAGETPSEEELRAMEKEALGGDADAA